MYNIVPAIELWLTLINFYNVYNVYKSQYWMVNKTLQKLIAFLMIKCKDLLQNNNKLAKKHLNTTRFVYKQEYF